MTVCIAAICRDGEGDALVSASDMMASLGGITTADAIGSKVDIINQNWLALIAGDDVSIADSVLDEVRRRLPFKETRVVKVASTFAAVYRDMVCRLAEQRALSRYKMRMTDFVRMGRKRLGDSLCTRLGEKIERVTIDCEFLVYGFDRDGLGRPDARLFKVCKDGTCENYTRWGLWAIGSGASSALTTMFFHAYRKTAPLPFSVYHVCEAKFMAERSWGVGPNTHVIVARGGKDGLHLTMVDPQPIRELWQKHGRPRVPADVEQTILPMIPPSH